MKPITAVLSPGSTTPERNAVLGAISIDAIEDRRTRKKIAKGREAGTGIRERAIAEGRCVKTMVLTRPIRREREAAMMEEKAERRPVVKKREPSSPSGRLNLMWKK
jgi:hypothetical protein